MLLHEQTQFYLLPLILRRYQSFISGAVAGGSGPLVSAPMDIVKTRMQSANGPKYSNVFSAVASIVNEEGVLGVLLRA